MTSRDRSRRVRSCVSSVLTAAVVSTLFAASVAAQDTTGVGAISGVVVNAAGQPAEGVRVCALDTASCATSDARGAFRIGELRAGAYRLEILPLEGLPFTSDPVDVRAGLNGTVDITLPRVENVQQTVTVTAPAFRQPEEVKNSGFLVEPRQILKSAAALQDVSRYVQGLPGVVIGTDDFRNDIIVRGGAFFTFRRSSPSIRVTAAPTSIVSSIIISSSVSDTASCATSDARGAFRIGELRAGSYRLEILPLEGLPFTSDPVDVRAGLDGTVEIALPSVGGLRSRPSR